jgi:type II secretory pathway component GspD/PulD (secretin)
MMTRILGLAILSGLLAPAQPQPAGRLSLRNAPLLEVINSLASQAGINYVLDPRVKIATSVNTYGESQDMDAGKLLDLILQINGARIVAGDVTRIVPLEQAPSPAGATVLDLVFLKNMTAGEISNFLSQTAGRATVILYAPAGLLMIMH